jgi:transposase
LFLSQLEGVLDTYQRPYDPRRPVVCFDERPCFLIGDVVEGLAPQPGRAAKSHYAYTKPGSAVVLAAVEPLTGQRLYQVHARRTKAEYTLFMQALAARYPDAETICVVQDNLNTHNASAFYENLPAPEARALAQRFSFLYTPKCASWLNMIEIDFSALSRQCLNRRIPTQEDLTQQVLTWAKERHEKRVPIIWQFTNQQARQTLRRHYVKVNSQNT